MEKMEFLLEEIVEKGRMFLNPDTTLESIAGCLATNRSYLSRAIHEIHGCSFTEYVNGLRIEYALNSLKDNHMANPNKLTLECGFRNRKTFERNFRKFTGINYSEWIKIH